MENYSDLMVAYHSIIDSESPEQSKAMPAQLPFAQAFKIYEIEVSDSDDEPMEQPVTVAQEQGDSPPEPIRSKHEIPLSEIPVGDIPDSIPTGLPMYPVARVSKCIQSQNLCICDSLEKTVGPSSLLLDENRVPITRVIELFGPIDNSKVIIKGIYPEGTTFYAIEAQADFPDPEEIERKYIGTDASNRFDEPESFQSSDDDASDSITTYY